MEDVPDEIFFAYHIRAFLDQNSDCEDELNAMDPPTTTRHGGKSKSGKAKDSGCKKYIHYSRVNKKRSDTDLKKKRADKVEA